MTIANLTTPSSPLTMSALATFLNGVFALIDKLCAVGAALNFNSGATDNAITINLPAGFTRYVVTDIRISGASASISTATLSVYTATGGSGGSGVAVASDQAITVTSASQNTNNNAMSLTLNDSATRSYNAATLYARVGTAEGGTATANVSISYKPLP
jgi:hypothetical protein